MAYYIQEKNLREVSGKSFRINEIYNPYRSGGLEVNGKYVGKSFYVFPKDSALPDIIESGDERVKEAMKRTSETEMREKRWDKNNRVFVFERYKGKLDREFFSTYKKVFDLTVNFAENVTVTVWNKEAGARIPTVVPAGEEIRIEAFKASKLRAILESLDVDSMVERVDGKDKAGNPAKVLPFDWEDTMKEHLKGSFITCKVKGEGMDTKYTFAEAKAFSTPEKKEELTIDDCPF